MWKKLWAYSMSAAGHMFRMNRVGPATKMNSESASARAMLMFDSQRMPRPTPETAEAMKPAVRTATIAIRAALGSASMPLTISTPLPICIAPMPSEAAVPKRVATMANMSTIRPATPSTRFWPSSATRMELISGTRPRRKAP